MDFSTDSIEADLENLAEVGAGTFLDMFTRMGDAGQNLAQAFGNAMILGMIRVVKSAIQVGVSQILVEKIVETAKAFIKAPFTLGASLLAIAPIAAAAGAGIAALSALEGRFTAGNTNLRTGGITRGGETVHPREIVFNPAVQGVGDFFDMLGQLDPGMAAAASGGDNIPITIHATVDSEDRARSLGRIVAEEIRIAKATF